VARVLIVEGADRGLHLAEALLAEGYAVRVTTSDSTRSRAIEAVGGECLLGTPERLATLRGALEHVTVACWLLADVEDPELARALHGPRLERFLGDAIDSTLRGFVYEAGGNAVPPDVLAGGKRIVSETARLNSIPVALLTEDPLDPDTWLAQALTAIGGLLEGR
jgi:NAD(P)-dependent dehydrogenase (short-subunit alcohol dehydrogenase family)